MANVFGTPNSDILDWTKGATSDADKIFGDGGNDWIKGGGGADELHGGIGIDTASYLDSPAGVTVYLNGGTLSTPGIGGTAAGDRLRGIENVAGSPYGDHLYGDWLANTLWGEGGYDELVGHEGDDTLYGWTGNDHLSGRAGDDYLDGDEGEDYADYRTSPAGVWIDLVFDVALGGDAQGDTLVSIENVLGSTHPDLLFGNDDENVLEGGDDNDQIFGRGGNDTLRGDDNADWLYGGANDDYLSGGFGADAMWGGTENDQYVVDEAGDSVIEFAGEGDDVVFVLESWTLPAGSDVEVLDGGRQSGWWSIDITGNATNNVIHGNTGSNVINGGGGNDELTGYAGQDSFLFNTTLVAGYDADITDFSLAQDMILLHNAVFAALPVGDLNQERFVVGTVAQQDNDNILYDIATGALFYDSDGNGVATPVQFASVTPGLMLTHAHIEVV
jgi:serralysin